MGCWSSGLRPGGRTADRGACDDVPDVCAPLLCGVRPVQAGGIHDIVAGFEHESDAVRFLADLRARLEKFALSLHPDKTRLIEFGRHAADNRGKRGLGMPETFNFLGFTHICGRSRAGYFQLKRKTRRDRMRVKLKALKGELRRRMHAPIPEQGRWLAHVVRGYFAYHAVPPMPNGWPLFATM